MGKNKILFALPEMNVGGVEKALLGLLSTIDCSSNEVTLALINKRGGLMPFLSKDINITVINGLNEHFRLIVDTPYQIVGRFLKKFQPINAIRYSIKYFKCKKVKSQIPLFEFIYHKHKIEPIEYDVAVAYSGPFHALEYYILNFINAKRKICWIHFDVSKFGINNRFVEKFYPQFDEINIVSQQGKDVFDKRFPALANKTKVVYNIVDRKSVLSQSSETVDDMPMEECDHVRIVTVGRVSEEKGQYDVLPYFKAALDAGLKAVWYFVGGGKDVERCQQKADELGIADNVKILGVKVNPYPYMRHCDIYVQPSRHEGYCITLAEAKLFEHPIITTPFTGAKEQLEDYPSGVTLNSLEELPAALRNLTDSINSFNVLKGPKVVNGF